VDELEQERFAQLEAEVARLRNQIEEAVSGLRAAADALATVPVKDPPYGVPRATVQASRDTLVRKFRSLSENFQAPALHRFADLTALKTGAEQVLSQAGEVAGTHARHLVVQFAADVRNVKVALKQLHDAVLALDRLIATHQPMFTACSTLRNHAGHMSALLHERQALAAQREALQQRIHELAESQHALQERVTQLTTSPEYAALQAQRERADAVRRSLRTIQGRFESEFAMLNKPLRKFTYVVGLDKEERQLLEQYLQDSWRTLTKDGGRELTQFLGQLGQAIASGRVKVKEPGKTLQRLEHLRAEIPTYLAQNTEHVRELQAVDRAVSQGVRVELEALHRQVDDRTKQLEDARAELQRLDERQTQLTTQLDDARRVFQETTRQSLQQEVEVTLPEPDGASAER
jgi:chromosome segregation ATPase